MTNKLIDVSEVEKSGDWELKNSWTKYESGSGVWIESSRGVVKEGRSPAGRTRKRKPGWRARERSGTGRVEWFLRVTACGKLAFELIIL